jgi:hypothetical protein
MVAEVKRRVGLTLRDTEIYSNNREVLYIFHGSRVKNQEVSRAGYLSFFDWKRERKKITVFTKSWDKN